MNRFGGLGLLLVIFLIAPLAGNAATACTFNRDLTVGASGADVSCLQTELIAAGYSVPAGATGYFGLQTKAAVSLWQKASGITPTAGYFGPKSRTAFADSSSQVPGANTSGSSNLSPATSNLVVSAGPLPPPTLAVANALYVPFTAVTFMAGTEDVTVTSVTVQRVGPGSDGAFYNVDLLDEDGYYISTGYFNSHHQATMRDEFTVAAGESRTLMIAGDMAEDMTPYDGEMAGLMLTAVEASAPVTGTFPIMGRLQTMNSTLVMGSATAIRAADDPAMDRSRYINDQRVRFSGIRLQAGSEEDIRLHSISWEQVGTATESDLTNVVTLVGGSIFPTEVDGRYYTSVFPNTFLIKKGEQLDLVVQGDLAGSGSNRTVQFNIDDPTDIHLIGESFGYGVYTIAGGNTGVAGDHAAFITEDGTTDTAMVAPFYVGSVLTITPGGFTEVGRY